MGGRGEPQTPVYYCAPTTCLTGNIAHKWKLKKVSHIRATHPIMLDKLGCIRREPDLKIL